MYSDGVAHPEIFGPFLYDVLTFTDLLESGMEVREAASLMEEGGQYPPTRNCFRMCKGVVDSDEDSLATWGYDFGALEVCNDHNWGNPITIAFLTAFMAGQPRQLRQNYQQLAKNVRLLADYLSYRNDGHGYCLESEALFLLSKLLSAGVPILQAFALVGDEFGDLIKSAMVDAKFGMRDEGIPFHQCKKFCAIYGPFVAKLIEVGENCANLDKQLLTAARVYQRFEQQRKR